MTEQNKKKRKSKEKKSGQSKQCSKQQHSKQKHIQIWITLFSLLIIALALTNIPLEPKQGIRTADTTVTFSWFGLASKAFVDDNKEFSSPIIVEKNNLIVFEPGSYYWKTSLISPVKQFTIDSIVAITVEDKEDNKSIKNTGSVALLLKFFKNFAITGRAVLNLNESLEIVSDNSTKIIASQYDEYNEINES